MISRLGRTQLERFMGEAMSTMAVKRLVKAAENLILAVDGDEYTLGRVRQFVGQLGCELVEAATTEEIAQIVSLRTPRVAIVAIDAQLSDGLAVLEALSAHIQHLKVLLVGEVDRRVMAGACRIAAAHGLQVIGSIDRQFDSAELTSLLGPHVHAQRALRLDDLERALEEQQFLLHYQPKAVFGSDGLTIQGVEALVRWEHPQHGLLYPADFLPLMDTHDLLARLTDFVMASALRQAGLWHQEGLKLQLALNLSPGLVRDRQFPERIGALLQEYGVAPESVVIDVLEDPTVHDSALVLDVFTRLRILGVGLCLDNFGTGSSSLTQLFRMPYTELKVDGSLIGEILREPGASKMLEAIVMLAHTLGLTVCAEGVESRSALEILRGAGFDALQGRAICDSASIKQIEQVIRAWKRTHGNGDVSDISMTLQALTDEPAVN